MWASDVLDIAIGRDHTAVLLECRSQQSGEPSGIAAGRIVVLLGSNKHGQLGTISFTTSVEGAGTAAVASHTKPRSPSQNVLTLSDFQHVLPNFPEHDIAAVGCTWNSTFLVLSPQLHASHSPSMTAAVPPQPLIIGFGLNSHGQLGSRTGDNIPPHPANSSSSTHQAFATNARLIHLHSPSPTSASSHRTDVRLACGSEHVLALVRPVPSVDSATEAAVYGWGWNEHGNLGLSSRPEGEDLSDVWEPRRLWPMEGSGDVGGIVDVWAGNATSWIQVKGNGRRG
jgi:alpha-tubulin suppressor-like RCC1 family protein